MSTSNVLLRKTILVAFLAPMGCVGESTDDPADIDEPSVAEEQIGQASSIAIQDPSSIMPDPRFRQTILTSGVDWNKRIVSGYAVDGDGSYYNKTIYTLKNNSGIDNSPLPVNIKTDLKSNLTDDRVYSVSDEIVNEIVASEAQGSLTPALQAIAEPNEPPLPQPSPGPAPLKASSTEPKDGWFGPCSSVYVTYSKPVSLTTPVSTSNNLGGGFTGTFSVNGSMQASATMQVTLERKRYKVFGVCIPYAVRLESVRAYGNAMAGPTININGSVAYTTSWEKEIAKPSLGSIDFSVVGVPVHVPLHLPISIGYDLDATLSGSVAYNATQTASGTFDYKCTLNACSGTSSYSLSGSTAPTISGSGQTRIKPNAWLQVALRAGLYDENFAYAQVGVRPYARGDLWGYVGNSCGDADGNGTNETVNALTFDLDWQVHLTAETAAFGGTPHKWNDLWHTSRKHIGFWDLVGSSAVAPMLGGPSAIAVNTPQSFTEKMRPCWPYADSVNYQLTFGDGASTTSSGSPQTATSVSHAWSNAGTFPLGLKAVSDAHGRALNKTTTRYVQVKVPAWTSWLDRDDPGGSGDYETLADFVLAQQACANPVAIECQTTAGVDWTLAGQTYSCSTATGGVCVNTNQTCKDYRVRFLCP